MSLIFCTDVSGCLQGFWVFLYYKGTSRCHSSNSDKQIDNQEDKWALLWSPAPVLIFIFFLIESIESKAGDQIAVCLWGPNNPLEWNGGGSAGDPQRPRPGLGHFCVPQPRSSKAWSSKPGFCEPVMAQDAATLPPGNSTVKSHFSFCCCCYCSISFQKIKSQPLAHVWLLFILRFSG